MIGGLDDGVFGIYITIFEKLNGWEAGYLVG
jgi:hypothetical protein